MIVPRRGPVLLVGEDADVRDILAHLLECRGHEVVTAAGPDEVAGHCRQCTPACVLVEAMLPSEDWSRLIETLQQELGAECPPIVALTGSWFLDEPASLTDSVETVIGPQRGEDLLALVARYCTPLRAETE